MSAATVASIGSNVESHDNTGLLPGTLYCYQVYAHNPDGASGLSNIASATTNPEPHVTLSLTAVGGTSKGKHVINPSWNGAAGANVDVYRDGGKIATIPNTGAYFDATGQKTHGAIYIHKVCEQGSNSVCFNETVTSY